MKAAWALGVLVLAFGCGDGTLVVDDGPEHSGDVVETGGANNAQSSTNPGAMSTSSAPTVTEPAATSNNGATTNGSTGTTSSSTNNGTVAETTGPMTTGPQFDPMFVAVADFMREKCVNCHDQGQNGNLVVPSPDVGNDELRMNLDGVVATTGRMLVEPNDPAESQVYIMITNSAGEQFPPETIAIVEDWINAGAPYETD